MLRVYDLKTEYRTNPVGIDATNPRLSWKLESDGKNVYQESYEVTVAVDEDYKNILWNSGVVKSQDSVRVAYEGPTLTSGKRVYWKVRVTAGGEVAEASGAYFEMALLKKSDWVAKWIEEDCEDIDIESYKPALYLRKRFNIKGKIIKARAYQTAHGLYSFWINGKQGTEDVFNPGFTSYYTRLQYQCYDVTDLLKEGENVWAVMLGDGWWRGMTGGMYRNNFGYQIQFLGQIKVLYEDGSEEIIATDDKFVTSHGAIVYNDMKFGEIYDCSEELNGWTGEDYDDSTWKKVKLSSGEHTDLSELIPTRSVTCREKEHFSPQIFHDKEGSLILDFGQNIAGYVSMKLRNLKPGQKVTLIHSEMIANGVFSVGNVCTGMSDDEHYQQIDYIAGSEKEAVYKPSFSIFGFQYVKLDGYDESLIQEGDFEAIAVYSDMEQVGDFSCSNKLINQLVKNSRWSQKGNFLDVPTDCPTRERSPWTGDSQVYVKTASRFMNVYPFFEKWMMDVTAEQYPNGMVANSVPATTSLHYKTEVERLIREGKTYFVVPGIVGPGWTPGVFDGSAGWGDTASISPYQLYLTYGDKRILENQYETARRWVNYMISSAKEENENRKDCPEYATFVDGIRDADYIFDTHFHFGEWLEPYSEESKDPNEQDIEGTKSQTNPLVATTYLYWSSHLVSEMAKILGIQKDAEYYAKYADNVKRVYNKYFIQEDGTIQKNHQASYVRTLQFGLADESNIKKVQDKLITAVRDNGMKLNTGFLSTPFLLFQILKSGYKEEAFEVLEQTEAPSWLHAVELGATTILEDWNSMDAHMNSFNHYSYGAVCDFLFGVVAGIEPIIDNPGYKEFEVAPVIGGTLTEATAEFNSQYGIIRSSWKKEGRNVKFNIEVPVNTTAHVKLPDGQYYDIGSGKYQYWMEAE